MNALIHKREPRPADVPLETDHYMEVWWRRLALRPHWEQAEILTMPTGLLARRFNASVVLAVEAGA